MIDLFRRKFLIGAGLLASTPLIRAVLPSPAFAKEIDPTAKLVFPYAVPALPYSYDANEPAIDTLTMQIYHDKHHGAYVSNLNAALNDHSELQGKTLPELLAGLNEFPKRSARPCATMRADMPTIRCSGRFLAARAANPRAISQRPFSAI